MITYYALKDYATKFDCDQLDLYSYRLHSRQLSRRDQRVYVPWNLDQCPSNELLLVAKPINETRFPLAKEWYLSGVKPMAHRASGDGLSNFQILKLVIIKKTAVFTEV